MSNKLTPRLDHCVCLQLWAGPMKIQHFYVNPAVLLSGIWTINYFKHRDSERLRESQPARKWPARRHQWNFDTLGWALAQLTGDGPDDKVRWEAGYLCSYLVCLPTSLPGISGCWGADTVKHVLTLGTHGLYATMTPPWLHLGPAVTTPVAAVTTSSPDIFTSYPPQSTPPTPWCHPS